jgi:hypothetical protein
MALGTNYGSMKYWAAQQLNSGKTKNKNSCFSKKRPVRYTERTKTDILLKEGGMSQSQPESAYVTRVIVSKNTSTRQVHVKPFWRTAYSGKS